MTLLELCAGVGERGMVLVGGHPIQHPKYQKFSDDPYDPYCDFWVDDPYKHPCTVRVVDSSNYDLEVLQELSSWNSSRKIGVVEVATNSGTRVVRVLDAPQAKKWYDRRVQRIKLAEKYFA